MNKRGPGNVYRQRRLKLGYTVEQVAEVLDISVNEVYKIETGLVTPNLSLMIKLTRLLDIPAVKEAAELCYYSVKCEIPDGPEYGVCSNE
jgi:transcriptional regulator with XRE-family HTH domain